MFCPPMDVFCELSTLFVLLHTQKKANKQTTFYIVFLINKFIYKLKPPSLIRLIAVLGLGLQ